MKIYYIKTNYQGAIVVTIVCSIALAFTSIYAKISSSHT